MISSLFRFHGYGSLRQTYSKGQTIRSQFIVLKFLPNDRRKHFRLSVVVSKKINKSAVARNQIRRRIYESIRHISPNIQSPVDIVITVVNQKVSSLSPAELDSTLKNLLAKANIIS